MRSVSEKKFTFLDLLNSDLSVVDEEREQTKLKTTNAKLATTSHSPQGHHPCPKESPRDLHSARSGN